MGMEPHGTIRMGSIAQPPTRQAVIAEVSIDGIDGTLPPTWTDSSRTYSDYSEHAEDLVCDYLYTILTARTQGGITSLNTNSADLSIAQSMIDRGGITIALSASPCTSAYAPPTCKKVDARGVMQLGCAEVLIEFYQRTLAPLGIGLTITYPHVYRADQGGAGQASGRAAIAQMRLVGINCEEVD
jgi:hypothetical protein